MKNIVGLENCFAEISKCCNYVSLPGGCWGMMSSNTPFLFNDYIDHLVMKIIILFFCFLLAKYYLNIKCCYRCIYIFLGYRCV